MSFLAEPPSSPEVERLYDADRSDMGYVMNLTRLWGGKLFGETEPSVAVAPLTGADPSDDPT